MDGVEIRILKSPKGDGNADREKGFPKGDESLWQST